MYNRFDFEQSILSTWNITDHMRTIANALKTGDINPTDAVIALEGLAVTYDIKFTETFHHFEKSLTSRD